jgi:hypothetical protein
MRGWRVIEDAYSTKKLILSKRYPRGTAPSEITIITGSFGMFCKNPQSSNLVVEDYNTSLA